MQGYKHLVKCRCVLPQFKRLENPPQHQFVVFSVLDKDGNVLPKFNQCNNCGLIHKIVDICKSEIQSGKESMKSILKIEDVKPSLHTNIASILEANSCDLASWEAALFIVENKQWGAYVVLTKETEGNEVNGKFVRIFSDSLCKVETFTRVGDTV